jgi:hypothetical protein
MDAQRCQNHGPVRLLVPLWEFNHIPPLETDKNYEREIGYER